MKYISIKILKASFLLIFLITFFTSCSSVTSSITNSIDILNHKNLSGTNNFHSLVETLVEQQKQRLNISIPLNETVLVSDFVNLDKLKNRSKLGFLLSEHLKNSLSNRNVIVRAVELGEAFQIGEHGFNLLTRKQQDINKKFVDVNLAFVGTYTITTKSLIVFIKLIDIRTGNILSSANGSTPIDEEILELERVRRTPYVVTPLVL